MGARRKATDTAGDALFRQQAAAMNQELMLAVVRQHELAEAAEKLNAELQAEVAERKRVEDTLRASELRYRRLFESSMDGIMLVDADKGAVYDVNPRLMEMLGYSYGEIVGKKLWEISPPIDIETAKEAFDKLLKKEHARYENLPLETSDGRVIEVEVISNVYETGQARLIQCNVRDISERKALEKQKADFYAMITHDIRSPLTVISGYSELLQHRAGELDSEINEMVNAIMKSGRTIESLVNNFLYISRVEAGKVDLNPAPTDIPALLRDACLEVENVAQEKKHDLIIEIADGLPKAMVDSRLIKRAVLNLLHNAVNYTPSPGKITLGAETGAGGFIIIYVSDTGRGIPAGEQKAVFEKYYRSKKTSGSAGSGLGLAIVKAAAEAHGGRVELESKPGKGCTFRLFIPVNQKTEDAA